MMRTVCSTCENVTVFESSWLIKDRIVDESLDSSVVDDVSATHSPDQTDANHKTDVNHKTLPYWIPLKKTRCSRHFDREILRNFARFLDQLEAESTGILRCCGWYFPSCFKPSKRQIWEHFEIYHLDWHERSKSQHLMKQWRFNSKIASLLEQCTLLEQCREQSRRWQAYAARSHQWNVLRLLRTQFNLRHRQFLFLAAQSKSGLKKFRKQCRVSAELLNTGILTSKDILRGFSRVSLKRKFSLKRVFSLLLLSYAMAAVRDPGRLDSFSPPLSDFSVWRQSLLTETDRQKFDKLVSVMWPEVSSRINDRIVPSEEKEASDRQAFDELVSVMWPDVSSQLNDRMVPSEEKEASDRYHDTLDDPPRLSGLGHFLPMISSEREQTSMHDTVSSIFDHSPGDEFDFSIFLNMEMFDEPSVTEQLYPQPLSSTSADVNPHGSIISPADERANIHESVSVRDLVRNIFFLQILRFMICEL